MHSRAFFAFSSASWCFTGDFALVGGSFLVRITGSFKHWRAPLNASLLSWMVTMSLPPLPTFTSPVLSLSGGSLVFICISLCFFSSTSFSGRIIALFMMILFILVYIFLAYLLPSSWIHMRRWNTSPLTETRRIKTLKGLSYLPTMHSLDLLLQVQ